MTYVHPSLITAHASLVHATPARPKTPTAPQPETDWKITGTDRWNRPDDESEWIERTGQWRRKWLPGEKEAEAQRRVGDVRNDQQMELDKSRDELARQQFDYKLSAEQKNELAKINGALEDARRSGRFSDEEMGELERQAAARRLGIRPLPVPREDPPRPTFHTDENGQRWIMNGQKWEPVRQDKPKDDFAALLNLTPDTRTEMRRDPVTGKDESVDVPLTMDERLAEMEKLRQMRDKFNAGTPGTGGDSVLAALVAQETDPLAVLRQIFRQPTAGAGAVQAATAPEEEEEDEFAQYLRK